MANSLKFDIESYSLEQFIDFLVSVGTAERYILEAKQQLTYLDGYLQHPDIQAKTILLEHQYIDRDFLLDYSGYYVRCFSGYHRWCTRFHFFSNEFDKSKFLKYLEEGTTDQLSEEILNEHYLGFLVSKPLPETLIGRTCLKTYKDEEYRFFPYIRDYRANLFGTRLVVKSLAFQEQDSVAAACATSALWTVFQATSRLFQHQIPSPMAITKSAIERSPTESRAFPAADGLTDLQMAEAVRSVGLDPLVLPTDTNELLKSSAYAYLRAGVPVVMNCIVGDFTPPDRKIEIDDLEGHAIAIVGFRLEEDSDYRPGPSGILLQASKISKLYVHDDQVGPFARIEFENEPFEIIDTLDDETDDSEKVRTVETKLEGEDQCLDGHEEKLSREDSMLEEWISCRWGPDDEEGRIYITEKIVVPLVTQVRIPYHTILQMMLYFDEALETLRENGLSAFDKRQFWDIYLIASNELKAEWLNDATLPNELRQELVLTSLPRYVWRVTACDEQKKQTDFLFDPTDIEQGPMLIKIIGYDNKHYKELLRVGSIYSNEVNYADERLRPHGKIWENLRQEFERQ